MEVEMKQAFVLLLPWIAFGQTAAIPIFESVSVRVSKPSAASGGGGGFVGDNRVEFRRATMLELVAAAYGVAGDRVRGGPGWLDTDRFDVSAIAKSSQSDETLRSMMQALLAERFGLTVRKEDNELPVYALLAARRGPKLKEAAASSASDCDLVIDGGVRTYTCKNMTMAGFAARLRSVAAAYVDHPIIDSTGLTSAYDFALSWSPRAQISKDGAGISLFDALDRQLGLKLELRKHAMPVILIDRVNQMPAGSASPSAAPAPTEFEVADVKPSKPGANGNGRILKGGRVELEGVTLKALITLAYEIDDDRVASAPKWLETERFDIIAKAGSDVPLETLREMIRNLLAERFKLAVHNEEQPVTVYALTQGKRSVKLKESSGVDRSACKPGAGDGLRTFTCVNTTMAQLAERLPPTARGYLDHPVVDLTGLKLAYDFELSWAPKGRFNAASNQKSQPQGSVTASSDPISDLTLFEAVDRQLGLKLAAQKHPMPVIVIDHVERTPTAN
jgi:uncharacterized protein (TIGR03435 family)